MNNEDHLLNFIKSSEENRPNPINEVNQNIEQFGNSTRQKVEKIEATSDWIEIPLNLLPYNRFYKAGTRIFIRPAKTKEIESFAVVNEKNEYDVILKTNEILSACCRIQYPDGTNGGYRDIQNGDRMSLIILISKASAKKGRSLSKKVTCECNTENDIDFTPTNYEFTAEDEDIAPFFNRDFGVYIFPLENGDEVRLAPPTIGISEDIHSYIFVQTAKSGGKIIPNVSFMQVIPYLKAGQSNYKKLTPEQLEQEEYNFSKMNDERFMFIHDVVMNKMDFGIKSVKCNCRNCGGEVKAEFGYPNGVRSLFIVPNAFKQFIRQSVRVHDSNSPTA
jgi:hypothetical protein